MRILIKFLFISHFVLAFFWKNVLLTAKIKNTILVALESAESLYLSLVFSLWTKLSLWTKMCKNLTEIWQLMTKLGYCFFTPVFCSFCVDKVLLYPACDGPENANTSKRSDIEYFDYKYSEIFELTWLLQQSASQACRHLAANQQISWVVSLWRSPLTFVWPGVPKQRATTAPSSRSECHLTVFCINEIVPGYVVYLVNC